MVLPAFGHSEANGRQLQSYFSCIASLNDDALHYYPGSPEIARALLREQDRLVLMELHNNEIDVLRQHMHRDKRSAASPGWI